MASDWKECTVEVKKSLFTRNYVGTTFGGTLYQAADPFFMLLLVKILGIRDYIIWDQSAEIFFKKPARSTVTYHFKISDQEILQIKEDLETQKIIRPTFRVEGKDRDDEICVIVDKVIYIKKKT